MLLKLISVVKSSKVIYQVSFPYYFKAVEVWYEPVEESVGICSLDSKLVSVDYNLVLVPHKLASIKFTVLWTPLGYLHFGLCNLDSILVTVLWNLLRLL